VPLFDDEDVDRITVLCDRGDIGAFMITESKYGSGAGSSVSLTMVSSGRSSRGVSTGPNTICSISHGSGLVAFEVHKVNSDGSELYTKKMIKGTLKNVLACDEEVVV
jgi:hypothetical protein